VTARKGGQPASSGPKPVARSGHLEQLAGQVVPTSSGKFGLPTKTAKGTSAAGLSRTGAAGPGAAWLHNSAHVQLEKPSDESELRDLEDALDTIIATEPGQKLLGLLDKAARAKGKRLTIHFDPNHGPKVTTEDSQSAQNGVGSNARLNASSFLVFEKNLLPNFGGEYASAIHHELNHALDALNGTESTGEDRYLHNERNARGLGPRDSTRYNALGLGDSDPDISENGFRAAQEKVTGQKLARKGSYVRNFIPGQESYISRIDDNLDVYLGKYRNYQPAKDGKPGVLEGHIDKATLINPVNPVLRRQHMLAFVNNWAEQNKLPPSLTKDILTEVRSRYDTVTMNDNKERELSQTFNK
jgi:hypothetical protein